MILDYQLQDLLVGRTHRVKFSLSDSHVVVCPHALGVAHNEFPPSGFFYGLELRQTMLVRS